MNTYEQQANNFCTKYNVSIEITYKKHDIHFEGDARKRDIYSIYIKRGARGFSFDFGQSLNDSGVKIVNTNNNKTRRVFDIKDVTNKDGKVDRHKIESLLKYSLIPSEKIVMPKKPTNYSILACLTKHDPETFEDFCSNFGYDTDSKRAQFTYEAVKSEYVSLCALFNETEMNELQEIN